MNNTTKQHIMQEFAEYLKANPKEAYEFFKQVGILDGNGDLAYPYNKHKNIFYETGPHTCPVCYLKLEDSLCYYCSRTNCPIIGLGPVIS